MLWAVCVLLNTAPSVRDTQGGVSSKLYVTDEAMRTQQHVFICIPLCGAAGLHWNKPVINAPHYGKSCDKQCPV